MNIEKNVNLAIFASGSGTNAENIIKYFKDHGYIRVIRVYCNNPQAYVINRVKFLSEYWYSMLIRISEVIGNNEVKIISPAL